MNAFSETVVISDTAPLINLAKAGRLDILPSLYDSIIVPESVMKEMERGPENSAAEARLVRQSEGFNILSAKNPARIDEIQSSDNLGRGESEALALAEEYGMALIITDDADAKKVASERFSAMGTVGVVKEAFMRGVINKSELLSIADILERNRWIRSDLIQYLRNTVTIRTENKTAATSILEKSVTNTRSPSELPERNRF